mmetsp:Transcript_32537/g.40038  ORF Transcript_32537/g.40038 Transcript_32537/m.40038 type:complete len:143 (-) Transcript_32537:438-866(-)
MKFSTFQRALWFIDELEARWTLFQRQYPGAKVEEITWSKTNPEIYGSINDAKKAMARILGLEAKADPDNSTDTNEDPDRSKFVISSQRIHGFKTLKSMVHAQNLKGINQNSLKESFQKQNEDYIRKMNFSGFANSLITKVQF